MRNIYLVFLLLVSTITSAQNLKVANIFTDHAVLQRDVPISIWGWAKPSEKISLTFLDKNYRTKTAKSGKWQVTLPATAYGGPYTIKINSKKESILLSDIYIGDVWICSGQSNMAFVLSSSFTGEFDSEALKDPLIRHYRVPQSSDNLPSDELVEGGAWNVGNAKSVTSFTGVGYYFAKNIRKEFPDLPIGLINNSWGGAKIEPFMSAAALGKSQKVMTSEIKQVEEKLRKKQEDMLSHLGTIPLEDHGEELGWANASYNDYGWKEMKLPSLWEKAGLPNVDGVVWFRKDFTLNIINPQDSTVANLGRIDDLGKIWLNGKRIDTMTNRSFGYSDLRTYKLSNSLFKKGKNQLTIRAEDMGGGGGIFGAENELFVDTGAEKIDLASMWKYKVGEVNFNFLYGPLKKPTGIYNKMVHPITNFKTKGVLWYQGESNTNTVEMAQEYESQFKSLINQWRKDWKTPELPFYYVQLASFRHEPLKPVDDTWAHLRQSQFNTLDLPNTGMASAIDLGEANDIHPKNKKDVGKRLALIALNKTYGKSDIAYKNPSYKNHTIEKDMFLVTFKDYGEGLKANKYGNVNGFAIAGADGVFKWANAVLENNGVKVWSPDVKEPKAVRYGWHSNALDANLFSKNGLPVVPFTIE